MPWPVEAELLLQLLLELRIDALFSPVNAIADHADRIRTATDIAAAADGAGDPGILAGHLGDDLLDGPTGRALNQGKVNHHNAQQGGNNQQEPAGDIGHHCLGAPPDASSLSKAASFLRSTHQVSITPRSYLGLILGRLNLFQ